MTEEVGSVTEGTREAISGTTTHIQRYDISYQLGAYYDLRYRQYFIRYKFILGLSRYNEDDSVSIREEEVIIQPFEKYDEMDMANYWDAIQNEENELRSEGDDSDTPSPVYDVLNEMGTHIQKENPFDKVINEFLLFTYPSLDEHKFVEA